MTGGNTLLLLLLLQEGPPVVALRPSLDNRLLAVQRSPAMLELVDLASGDDSTSTGSSGRRMLLTCHTK